MPLIDKIFLAILFLAGYQVFDVYICRIVALAVLVCLLYISRLIASFHMKVFAVISSLILYFFPELIKKFVI